MPWRSRVGVVLAEVVEEDGLVAGEAPAEAGAERSLLGVLSGVVEEPFLPGYLRHSINNAGTTLLKTSSKTPALCAPKRLFKARNASSFALSTANGASK